jgi:hypothetical protein
LSDFYQLPSGRIVRTSLVADDGLTARAYDYKGDEKDIVFGMVNPIMRRDVKQLIDAETDEQKRDELQAIFEWMYKPPVVTPQARIERHVKHIRDIVQSSDIAMTDVIELLTE